MKLLFLIWLGTRAQLNAFRSPRWGTHALSDATPRMHKTHTQWFTRLFPPCHAPSRLACCLAAGDAKPEIRDAGLRGLGLAPGGGYGLGGGEGGAGPGAGGGAGELLAWLYPEPQVRAIFLCLSLGECGVWCGAWVLWAR